MLKEAEVVKENEKDPAWNCLVGTRDDIPCPVCGSHAWKRYGHDQHVACRKCGKQIKTFEQKVVSVIGYLAAIGFIIYMMYSSKHF